MLTRLEEVSSIEEFRFRAIGLLYLSQSYGEESRRIMAEQRLREYYGIKDVSELRFAQGLEEFVQYVIDNGTDSQKFAIGCETDNIDRGVFRTTRVKTMVYASGDELLLCLLGENNYVDDTKASQLLGLPDTKLKKASQEDLADLSMKAGTCHGFPSTAVERDWRVAVDEEAMNHSLYLEGARKEVSLLFASARYYTEVMEARFPGRVTMGEIRQTRRY